MSLGHWLLVLAVVSVVALPAPVHAAGRGASGWRLVWSDEFNGTSLNRAKWNAEDVASPRNSELEYYLPQNVSEAGGRLTLISRHQSYDGLHYTSAAVDTHGNFSFTYGKVVIRARLPKMGPGIWPALWMVGEGCNPVGSPCAWPAPGDSEIDIMEAVDTPSRIYMTPHYGPRPGEDVGPVHCTDSGRDFSAGYHTFSVVWQPGGRIRWFVDGKSRCRRAADGYFTGPMYLVMDTAVGGSWPASPGSSTPFPQRFQIDYVRVYQR